ncbi:MAG: hypothetical protein O7G85_03775 [Planctomycetota bacterium]|nr:hypothetical protein [Planctomycetota bacterium]
MPSTKHAIQDEIQPCCMPRHLEIRWSSLVHPRFESGNLSGAPRQGDMAKPYHVILTLGIHLIEQDHVVLEAWVEGPKGRHTIFSRQPLSCQAKFADGMLHLDCVNKDQRLLALTLNKDDTIVYAQSDLLEQAGFKGGSFDPPSIRRLSAQRDAASA